MNEVWFSSTWRTGWAILLSLELSLHQPAVLSSLLRDGMCELSQETHVFTQFIDCYFHVGFECKGSAPAQKLTITSANATQVIDTSSSNGVKLDSTRKGDVTAVGITIDRPQWIHSGKYELGGDEYKRAVMVLTLVDFLQFKVDLIDSGTHCSCRLLVGNVAVLSFVRGRVDFKLISNGRSIGNTNGPPRPDSDGMIVQDFFTPSNARNKVCQVTMKPVYRRHCKESIEKAIINSGDPNPTHQTPDTESTTSNRNVEAIGSKEEVISAVVLLCAAVVVTIIVIIVVIIGIRRSKRNRLQPEQHQHHNRGVQETETPGIYNLTMNESNNSVANASGVYRQAESDHELSGPIVCSPTSCETNV